MSVTVAGLEFIGSAERIIRKIEQIQRISGDNSKEREGHLTISTTHTFARYVLPNVIAGFLRKEPNVQIGLLQAVPSEVCENVQQGRAELGVTTEPQKSFLGLVWLPILKVRRIVIAPPDHPISKLDRITLEELARFPLIGHDSYRSGGRTIMDTFTERGIKPLVPFAGIHSDVAKTYVGMGLGIAITASMVYDPERDSDLVSRDVSDLFPSTTAYVTFRRSSFLRKIEIDFMKQLSPGLTRQQIRESREKSRFYPLEDSGDRSEGRSTT
ncbi:LysR substrate-binding domain-containing protein [Aquibium oceanicum]|uniref:LysR substrate-binding domain-containing protein n=1 Tax=Aquibium oceanicum TaxID=1670800 RepID=UPI001F38056A|nr:LysR substrate-binding domain-containing protein [Aquibium oceanicum]